MRFLEYEAREIVRRAGIPVSRFGLAKTPEEARAVAEEIGGPVVIKSQVLTGGRMKAGGVQFADTPDEAAAQAGVVRRPQDPGRRRAVSILIDETTSFLELYDGEAALA